MYREGSMEMKTMVVDRDKLLRILMDRTYYQPIPNYTRLSFDPKAEEAVVWFDTFYCAVDWEGVSPWFFVERMGMNILSWGDPIGIGREGVDGKELAKIQIEKQLLNRVWIEDDEYQVIYV
jgi:hypothetical protein